MPRGDKNHGLCYWRAVLLACSFSCSSLSGQNSGSVSEDMVRITAGSFTMGTDDRRTKDEGPAREVYLSTYYLARCEVTNAQFKTFVEATGYLTTAEQDGAPEKQDGIDWRHPKGSGSDISTCMDHPVVYVSWYDAQAYCAWKGKRLPTEAEWEKSARGTDGRIWPWGNVYDSGRANAWGREDGYEKTAPAGVFPQGTSPSGALDMAGNVWEWCADWYDQDYYTRGPDKDPQGPEKGQLKILRGGSWINPGPVLRTTNRFEVLPADRGPYVGLRCAQSE